MTEVVRATRAALGAGLRVARGTGRVVRAILGAPDYERYLTHMRHHHPGAAVASPAEFARQRLEERYSRPGARCC
jgi:uncharacterized short protein YbdD (DUF466 family)